MYINIKISKKIYLIQIVYCISDYTAQSVLLTCLNFLNLIPKFCSQFIFVKYIRFLQSNRFFCIRRLCRFFILHRLSAISIVKIVDKFVKSVMVFYVISCKRDNSQEFFNIEAIVCKFSMSSAIGMRSL